MTDDLRATDAYEAACEGTVVAVDGDGAVLDRTVFYARGGGQPGDTGTLTWDGGEVVVDLIPAHVDPIRVDDIDGIDRQADGGTHVRSTAEVGRVSVVKTESKGERFERMRIELVDR